MAALAISLDPLDALEQKMTEEEYLRGDFESDVDFVDDHIEERYVGEIEHSNWQRALIVWFSSERRFGSLVALPEVRVKVATRRYRVPDIALFAGRPQGRIVIEAPLAVFEILSPEDRHSRLKVRFKDYEKMGVRNLYLIEGRGEYMVFKEGRFEAVLSERSLLEGSDGFVDWAAVAALLI